MGINIDWTVVRVTGSRSQSDGRERDRSKEGKRYSMKDSRLRQGERLIKDLGNSLYIKKKETRH